ncbi:sodium/hydrogen exchanger 9B2 [Parasteatoda tepidariorum]|uniref:sodium/hydrogen exchanger 9B2 n=1 Tax=Parasteatoda tepidariorum TaxID=114398 RepID=UPI00077FA4E9|nr:sodium/hydrogen exchanger 9B2 [Parasteatoda tepidariorum]XP_042907435.1 sodium/hydrogen exchanger 9B2 [Parasteatoda tepidariorum]
MSSDPHHQSQESEYLNENQPGISKSGVFQCIPRKFKQWFPSSSKVVLYFTQGLVILLLFGTIYGMIGKDIFPVSGIFALFLLALLAHIGGLIVKIVRLPPLVGMLIVGFLFRNLSFITFYDHITVRWAASFRGSALVVILLKAGLGLDADKLKKLSRVVFQLSFTPCIVEAITIGVASHFLLQLPWSWSIMLGFVISAVSPAVIVPGLLNLQSKMRGTKKGIPTLVIAAASIDDILAITGFTVMLTIALTHDNLVSSVLKGLFEPIGGLIFGLGYGRLLWCLPSLESSPFQVMYYHILLLCLGGSTVMFFSKELGIAGAGPMGCLVLAFVAALNWKKDPEHFNYIEKLISLLWSLLQPFLFSLIGAEVSVGDLQSNLGAAMLTLFIGLVFRIMTAAFVTFGGGFNIKEKIFIAFAWLPKATVQAAIGSQALDYVVTNNGSPEMLDYAQKVLTCAVLSIMMTAPIGAAFISIMGPKLLTKDIQTRRKSKQKLENCDSNIQDVENCIMAKM